MYAAHYLQIMLISTISPFKMFCNQIWKKVKQVTSYANLCLNPFQRFAKMSTSQQLTHHHRPEGGERTDPVQLSESCVQLRE